MKLHGIIHNDDCQLKTLTALQHCCDTVSKGSMHIVIVSEKPAGDVTINVLLLSLSSSSLLLSLSSQHCNAS